MHESEHTYNAKGKKHFHLVLFQPSSLDTSSAPAQVIQTTLPLHATGGGGQVAWGVVVDVSDVGVCIKHNECSHHLWTVFLQGEKKS